MNLEELIVKRADTLKVGIMGGTFDPIHNGHLLVAQEAYVKFSLDGVIFVPTGQSYHKKDHKVSAPDHRFFMTFLATLDNPAFMVSRLEIDRGEASYTVDTLREMSYWFSSKVEFYFITGTDAVEGMKYWDRVEDIPKLCHVVAASRPGFDGHFEELPKSLQEVILPMQIPLTSISSTDIRRRVMAGESIKYLLPPSVESYISKMSLYQEGEARA